MYVYINVVKYYSSSKAVLVIQIAVNRLDYIMLLLQMRLVSTLKIDSAYNIGYKLDNSNDG